MRCFFCPLPIMILNTGLARVGFHYGVEEEVTPQFRVRELWQVRVVGHFETREPMRHRS